MVYKGAEDCAKSNVKTTTNQDIGSKTSLEPKPTLEVKGVGHESASSGAGQQLQRSVSGRESERIVLSCKFWIENIACIRPIKIKISSFSVCFCFFILTL